MPSQRNSPKLIPPKVLFFDLETSPNIAFTWGKYEQDTLGDFILERMIISMAWKWLGKDDVHAVSLPDFYGYKPFLDSIGKKRKVENKKLIERIHQILSGADILVAQNGNAFDIKMANSEFIQYGLNPLPCSLTIDTLKTAKSRFRFNSNKLDDLGFRLGLGRKLKTGGFDLWRGCMDGSKRAWKTMVDYNKQDVILLEKIYMKMRPWIKNHPNMNVLDAHPGCPVCKGTNLKREGWNPTKLGRRQQYSCKDCGSYSSGPLIMAGLELRPS